MPGWYLPFPVIPAYAPVVFANGTVSVKHSPGKGTQSFDPKTCLLTISFHARG
jgi:hypothetical protein